MELYQADCLEKMKELPDKSIDLFVCDLPYGCLTGGGGQEKSRRRFINGKDTGTDITQKEGVIAGCSWDIKIDLAQFWVQVKRLCKNDHTPVLMFCNMRFGVELINSNPDWFRYDLVWNKQRGVGFLAANKQPLRSHEMIFVFSKKGAKYNRVDEKGDYSKWSHGNYNSNKSNTYGEFKPLVNKTGGDGIRCVKSIISFERKLKSGQHPTEKPVELYKWLIERYSNEGDTVLDPTFGSCNSGKASVELKRKYIGIEKDKGFFDKANS